MGLFERERDFCLDVLTRHGEASAAASASTAAEQALEEIAKSALSPASAEQIAKIAKLDVRTLPPGWRPEIFAGFPVLPKLVIALAFVRIRENFVGLVQLLKFLFGRLITGIYVRVILARQLA